MITIIEKWNIIANVAICKSTKFAYTNKIKSLKRWTLKIEMNFLLRHYRSDGSTFCISKYNKWKK